MLSFPPYRRSFELPFADIVLDFLEEQHRTERKATRLSLHCTHTKVKGIYIKGESNNNLCFGRQGLRERCF